MKSFKVLADVEHEKVIRHEFKPSGELMMAEVINQLSQLTEGKSIVVTDVGQHQMLTSRYYQYKHPRTNVTSGGAGTMGFALPAAMGAKMALPQQQVIAVIGDANNDIHLFKGVGYKVAMGNATDQLKAEADEVIDSVDDDGLAYFIERLRQNNA
jgi:hydroxymethylpyrimidine pyrophosphatase-like HAD family hydrolase